MRMFTPSGEEILVDKAQVPALEASGWTKTAPEVNEEPEEVEEVAEEAAEEAAEKVAAPAKAGEKKTIPVRRKKKA